LGVLEVIEDISARMVVNRVSMKMKADRINPLIQAVRVQLDQNRQKAAATADLAARQGVTA